MASMATRDLVRFDEYELDLGAIELRREGQVVPIEPQGRSLALESAVELALDRAL